MPLYERDADLFVPTALTRGPWDPRHQHAGPPSALLARAVDAAGAIAGAQLVRIAVDVLGPVPLAPLRIEAQLLRPGRRVEQVEATLALADGPPLMRARAWRMRTEAPPLADPGPEPPPPGPDGLAVAPRPSFWVDDEGYVDALEWRFASGDFEAPGPAAVWARLRVPLVAGEPVTPVQRLLVMADAASGVSAALDWARFSFANLDLSVALERPPEGEWLAMDAATHLGDRGAGVCAAVLSDARGRVGVSTQALFIAAR